VRRRALLVGWHGGGNTPPLLAAGSLLRSANFEVIVLASDEVRREATRAGFDRVPFLSAPPPETHLPFERVAMKMMATAAGADIAADMLATLAQVRPALAVVDCMLPAAIAACERARTPCVSLVHFAYGHARAQMLDGASAWTTDRTQLDDTRCALGLAPTRSDVAAWESPDLLLVTAPLWFDTPTPLPANVIHAGPLGFRRQSHTPRRPRALVLVSFSTTQMRGQREVVQRVCDAVASVDVDAILTLGPALVASDFDLPDNVTAIDSAEHEVLLGSAAAVITHGGLGTTLRSLAHGLPLLLIPLGRDQHFNAGRVVELGAGIRLSPDTDRGRILAAVKAVLTDNPLAKEARRLAARIRAEDPDGTALTAMLSVANARS
jgi:UDP:flavonoid glycosyltransferase YjiC (YdhE family)